MTNFFDNVGAGSGAPSPILKNVNDYVQGEIVDMYERDYIPFGKKEPERKADGAIVKQLVIVLQTQHRNWENVSKVPRVDPADPNSPEKSASEDDGKRAVYVPEGKNIQFAIARAIQPGTQFVVGGTLGVKVFNLKPTDKGNPLKEHQAVYTPPSAAAGFMAGAQQAPAQAPVQQAPAPAQPAQAPAPVQQAPATQDPWATQAPAQQAPAPTQDPWATPAPSSAPPF